MDLYKRVNEGKGVDTGPHTVALIALVKLPWNVASDGTHLYLDLPALPLDFTRVLYTMF